METTMQADLISHHLDRAGTAQTLDVFGAQMILRGSPGRDGIMVGEHIVPPGYMVPPHSHADDDEFFLIQQGSLTLLAPGGERTATQGGFVALPRGSVHGFRNDTTEEVRFIVLCRPGVQAAEMFRHFDRAGRAAPGGLTPPEITAICAQYGVKMG